MIAEIRGRRGIEYVALHLDERTREPVWVPIRGDRGSSGEISQMMAVAMCVQDLREWLAPAVEAGQELHTLCDRRRRARTADEEQRVSHLARQIADSHRLAWAHLARLIDAPHDGDCVEMDAEVEPRPRPPAEKRRERGSAAVTR